ncbi:MAG: FecR domain-containing protein [Myxococcota bacterium]
MSHLEHDVLWGLARNELDAGARAQAERHLADCADCRVSLEDVKLAQGVLMDLPPVPAMPEAMARRVGQSLAEAADAQVARRFTSWWQSLFTPRFMLASALGVVLVIGGAWLLAPRGEPTPTSAPLAVTPPTPTPSETPAPTKKKLAVTVASAKKASAAKKQVLSEGATVATQSGGNLWMQLPDGSRAGLTGASEVTLATLEEKQLTLDVAKGSLALVVPHREDRVLTVRAGEVEVKDLGTRFLVSREPTHTFVAVEEGLVEVKTPAGTREVRAGHAVTWRGGKLSELDWAPVAPPAAVEKPVVAKPETPPIPEQRDADSIARLEEEDEAPLPPVEDGADESAPQTQPAPDQTPATVDEQWAGLPEQPKDGKQLPPVSAFTPPKKVVTSTERGFSLRIIERKLREIGTVITSPSGREARARNVLLAADAGDCAHALKLADAWLSEPVTNAPNEPLLRRSVQLQQVRCLNRLGRTQDAATLQRMLETAH